MSIEKNHLIDVTECREQSYTPLIILIIAFAPLPLKSGRITPVFRDSHTEQFSRIFYVTETDVSIKEVQQIECVRSKLTHQTPLPLNWYRYMQLPRTQEAGLKPQCSGWHEKSKQ